MERETKICVVCGREFAWRKKWADDWERVKYCSKRCRGTKLGEVDTALENVILELLDSRKRGATICPSEATRRVRPDDWRDWMERTRMAARRLVADGQLEITQKGAVADPSTARGPIRLRRT